MTASLSSLKEYQSIFHWAETQQNGAVPSFGLRKNDPYEVRCEKPDTIDYVIDNVQQYQSGFINRYFTP